MQLCIDEEKKKIFPFPFPMLCAICHRTRYTITVRLQIKTYGVPYLFLMVSDLMMSLRSIRYDIQF